MPAHPRGAAPHTQYHRDRSVSVCTPPSLLLAVLFAVAVGASCTRETPPRQPAHDSGTRSSTAWGATRVDTLLRLGRADQQGREELARAIAIRDTASIFAAMRADSARTRWLRAAITRHGWPSRAAAGDSAQKSAWLILQHSPDTAWQAAMLPELERLGRRGELPLADLALLIDRVLMHRGQPQRYGSQFAVANGRLVPAPVADLARLDERRADMGLPPMAEYVKLLAHETKLPVTWPPEH
jgi:hypothetical protein